MTKEAYRALVKPYFVFLKDFVEAPNNNDLSYCTGAVLHLLITKMLVKSICVGVQHRQLNY